MKQEYKYYFEPEEYKDLDEKIYTEAHHSNILSRAFHNMRFRTTRELVRKYHVPGKQILDMCSGLCEWNTTQLDVKGLDFNQDTLNLAKQEGRISEILFGNALKNNIKDESFDMLVNTGSLEHVKYPSEMLNECKRLLKDDGILVLGVPYDTFFSLWRPMFFLRCFIHGKIKGDRYFLKQGGHINNFSPNCILGLLKSQNFKIIEVVNDYRMFFTVVAQKDSESEIMRSE